MDTRASVLGYGMHLNSRVQKHSYVIPSEVEGPLKCGTRHPSRRGPSTTLRMTPFGCLGSLATSP